MINNKHINDNKHIIDYNIHMYIFVFHVFFLYLNFIRECIEINKEVLSYIISIFHQRQQVLLIIMKKESLNLYRVCCKTSYKAIE